MIPKVRDLYAIHHGDYVGEMWAFCDKNESGYIFLSIPKMVNRECPVEKFEFAIDNGITEKVKRLPRRVFKIIIKQYKKNERDEIVDSGEMD